MIKYIIRIRRCEKTHMQPSRLKPHVLALGTMVATSFNELSRRDHSSRMLLDACGRNPPRRVLRIGLDERVEQHARTLDVANFRFGLEHDAVQIGEVAFRVDGCGGAGD